MRGRGTVPERGDGPLRRSLRACTIVSGSLIGGVVMHVLGDQGYAVIFVSSALCRAAVMLTMARGVGVRRRAGEHSFRNVFVRVLTLRPGEGEDIDALVLDEEPRHVTQRQRPGD